jgi:hypothetical protein
MGSITMDRKHVEMQVERSDVPNLPSIDTERLRHAVVRNELGRDAAPGGCRIGRGSLGAAQLARPRTRQDVVNDDRDGDERKQNESENNKGHLRHTPGARRIAAVRSSGLTGHPKSASYRLRCIAAGL